MWNKLTKYLLRRQYLNIAIIGALTLFMGYKATQVQMSYEYAQMLPASDSVSIEYQNFKKQFEEDGSVLFAGINSDKLRELNVFNEWMNLTTDLKKVDGVSEVISIANCVTLTKDTAAKKFVIKSVFESKPQSQVELDSMLKKVYALSFYDEMLFNSNSDVNILLVYIKKEFLNTSERVALIDRIKAPIEAFGVKNSIEIHYSGMPYIRTSISNMVQQELKIFMILALVIASLILLFFFRSLKAIAFSVMIVVVGVVWTLGSLVLFGYDITILSGILPPVLIIIGIENCIYLITKYHSEYALHKNQAKALTRVVQKVGYATLLTNLTTAVGFGSFMITGNSILVQFGVVAFINIILMFVFTLVLIPTLYSLYEPPKDRHIKHLQFNWMAGITRAIASVIQFRRKLVLVVVIVLLLVSGFGISLIENKGSMVDDIPKGEKLYTDMMFFEENMGGVLPMEVTIDTHKKKGIFNLRTLQKIDKFQQDIRSIPSISKPLSVVEIVKFAKQAFYNGRSDMYSLPNENEKNFILNYLPDIDKSKDKNGILTSFIDTNYQVARISLRLKNIYTPEIREVKQQIRTELDSLFPADKFTTVITGSTMVFEKGSNYLVTNLIYSLLLAVLIIGVLMFLLFNNFQMVLISMASNLIPLTVTAGLMGFLGIDLKPSTIIIYSIALGISVDAAIHLLSRYRQQLKATDWQVKESILAAVKETSNGMIYSGIVLVLGFLVFILSRFGGTQSLGYLIGFTLLIAMFCNLIILPSLILYYDKRATTKSFRKPVFEILDDEDEEAETEDIEK
jgi:predicted RND superfamily exporter protein